MAFKPIQAGPRTIRQLYHWAWRNFRAIEIEGTGGVEEAPIDGKPYNRQDAGWVEDTGGGSGDRNVDGGAPDSVYTPDQVLDGGGP